jgi:predicted NodU family carbamoyl transferase
LDFIPVEKVFIPHHIAHAASAFWASGFSDAACLVYDGGMSNEEWFGGVFDATTERGVETDQLFSASRYANVTKIYTAVTVLLGFQPLKHEGKITGLAATGEPTNRCRDLLEKWLHEPSLLGSLLVWENMYQDVSVPKLSVVPGVAEALKEEIRSFSDTELAATVQRIAEEHITKILEQIKQEKQSKNLCLSGGLFANVKVNQRASETGFDNTFITPAMSDDGTALGSALHFAATNNSNFSPKPLKSVYLGPRYNFKEVQSAVRNSGAKIIRTKNIPLEVAQLLNEGAIVAVFNGSMEFGPRALGNRSILAKADNYDINRKLNRLLHRTEFMPFAPICCEEDAQLLFKDIEKVRHAAHFMTVTVDCTKKMSELHPAVVHVDGTARPQLVSSKLNKLIYEILTNYKELSGKFALINTSFNIHEEPIIMSPDDALKGFFESGIDAILLEDKLIKLSDNSLAELSYVRSYLNAVVSSNRQIKGEVYTYSVKAFQANERADKALALAEQAETRAETAEAETKVVEASAAQANERADKTLALVEQAETRAETAEAETKVVEASAAQANERADKALALVEQAETRAETAEAKTQVVEASAAQANERADKALALAEQAETRAEAAEAKTQVVEASAAQANERADKTLAQLFDKEQALAAKHFEIEQLHAHSQWLQKEWDAAKIKIDELNHSSHHWWTVADDQSRELEAVYHSKSWRITWPLRKLMQLLKWLLWLPVKLAGVVARAARWVVHGSFAWLTLRPGSRPRRTARLALLHLRNWMLLRPRVKARVLSFLRRFPRLKAWLRRLHYANPMKTGYTTAPLSRKVGRMPFEPSLPDDAPQDLPAITARNQKLVGAVSDILDPHIAERWSHKEKTPGHPSIGSLLGHVPKGHDPEPRILQLTTYAIEEPDHGGKHRCHQIRKRLQQEYQVYNLAFEWGTEPSHWPNIITLDATYLEKNSINGYLADIVMCDYIYLQPNIYRKICEMVRGLSPTAILLEQPYLWPLVQRLIDDEIVRSDINLIYSSHNIEIKLKNDIYRKVLDRNAYSKNLTKVFYVEEMAIRACDAAIAVSEIDAEFIKSKNVQARVKVFGNGSLYPELNDLQESWDIKFNNKKTNWVFVGSQHEPNIIGLEMLTNELSKLEARSFTLWVFGGAGLGLVERLRENGVTKLPAFLKIMGPADASDIDAAILGSSGVVLPIIDGGGSNLKTAQALLSKKYILGTTHSFRSFETYIDEPGVCVCDSIAELSSFMAKKKPEQNYVRTDRVLNLHWDAILEDLPAFLGSDFQ